MALSHGGNWRMSSLSMKQAIFLTDIKFEFFLLFSDYEDF